MGRKSGIVLPRLSRIRRSSGLVGGPVDGYAAWYDASDEATITHASGAVSTWQDKSGNGHHLLQATAANKPTTGTRTQNGLNVIDFDGTSDFLEVSTLDLSARPNSVFGVVLPDTLTGADAWLGPTGTGGRQYGEYSAQNKWGVAKTSTAWLIAHDAVVFSASTPYVLAFVCNATQWISTVNGDAPETDADSTAFTASLPARMGGASGATSVFWNGWIAEVLAYNSELSDAARQANESYLMSKWGI